MASHHKAHHEGVRDAAEIRAREIREDFSWAEQALERLRNLEVPCSVREVLDAGEAAELDALMQKNPEARRQARSGSASRRR